MTLENSIVCTNRFMIARSLAPFLMMFKSWSIIKTDIQNKPYLVISSAKDC